MVRISRALLHRVYRIIKRLLLVLVVAQYFYMRIIFLLLLVYTRTHKLSNSSYTIMIRVRHIHRVCACPHHSAHRRISWYLGQTRGRNFDFSKRDLTKYDVGLRITRDDDGRCGLGAFFYSIRCVTPRAYNITTTRRK